MKKKNFLKSITAATLCSAMIISSVMPAFAADLSPKYTYKGGGVTFEKISHPETATENADGVVDYVGNGTVAPYVSGESELGKGDRGQSYSYASASYGDWVYINTMYGGLGANAILNRGFGDLDAATAQAMINAMYNGHMYTGEPDGVSAGGILFKFNVKTGETKILMSKTTNGIMPTFRSAIKMNGKLYFVGMIIDVNYPGLSQEDITKAIAYQNGFPCIYEVDPANDDKLTCVYNCVDNVDDFNTLVNANVFTSTRAIGTYKDSLIVGCLDSKGKTSKGDPDGRVFLCASKNPSAGQSSFVEIAGMDDLFNYPAYHRSDVNGGGGIYQVVEYNGALYVVICTGTSESINDHGTLQTFAIVKGTCNGDVTDKNAWSWSVLAGDQEKDGAKYPFGLDAERYSAGACTLQVYNDYLYIGDYNDVSSALQGFVLRKDFTTQATNLEQSVNLYRMDKNENIEKVVGDPTEAFPTSLTGLGSGYTSSDKLHKLGTHMNQYTWQTTVYNGKLYVGTMDTTTLLEPIAQFTNGDLLKMTPEQWKSQLNYIRVLLELLFKKPVVDKSATATYEDNAAATPVVDGDANDPADTADANTNVEPEAAVEAEADAQAVDTTALDKEAAEALVQNAIAAAQERADETDAAAYATFSADNVANSGTDEITLTDEQTNELVQGLLDGSIVTDSIDEDLMDSLSQYNSILAAMTSLIDTTNVEDFYEEYCSISDAIDALGNLVPDNIKALYRLLVSYATKDNICGFLKSLKYLKTSEAGFDLFEITDNGANGATVSKVTTDGFGDRYNHGLRIFEKTADYWVIGTANPFNGTQLWRTTNLDPDPVDPDPVTPVDPVKPVDPAKPGTDSGNTGKVTPASSKGSVKAASAKVAKTGDQSSPIIPIAVAGVSLVVIAGAIIVLRKKKH